jgi:hypothetical protein
MDAGHQGHPQLDDEDPLIDRYLLQFWPAAPAPDRVVKQTSAKAAYWHEYARTQPPPPTPAERAEAKRQAELVREQRDAELRLAEETRNWGGRLPSDRLRKLGWSAIPVARLDRPLLDAIDRVDPDIQRTIARWAARRAYTEGQLAQIDWIAPALEAMDRGQELPETFQDPARAFDRAWNDEQLIHTAIITVDGRTDNFSQQSMAFPALAAAYGEDPLRAAIDAVRIAADTFGYGRPQKFFAELRQAFPVLNQ